MGIYLESQTLALAEDMGIYKSAKDLKTGETFVTTQNHGYAVKSESLNKFKVWMINLDDKSVEGIYHPNKPIIATQFHLEASPKPLDST